MILHFPLLDPVARVTRFSQPRKLEAIVLRTLDSVAPQSVQ